MKKILMALAIAALVPFVAGATGQPKETEQEWELIETSDWGKCELNEDAKCGFRDGEQERTLTYAHYDWKCPGGYEENHGKCEKEVCVWEWFKKKCKKEYADKERVQMGTRTETESQSCQVADEDVIACEKEVIVEKEVIKEVPTFIDRVVEVAAVVVPEIKKPKFSLSQGPNGSEGDGRFQVEWKKYKDCDKVEINYSHSKTFGKDGKKITTKNDGAHNFKSKDHSKYYVKIRPKCGDSEWSKVKSIRP